MIKFIIEDKEVLLPEEWAEVTVKHFVNPDFLSGNTIRLLAALSGLEAIKLANASDELLAKFDKTFDFLRANPNGWKGDKPTTFTFMGKEMKVPTDIERCMFGQKIMFGEAMRKHNHIYQAIPEAIAIYFGVYIYPEDWFDRIDEIKEHTLELPISDVFSIVDFFLRSSEQLVKSGKTF